MILLMISGMIVATDQYSIYTNLFIIPSLLIFPFVLFNKKNNFRIGVSFFEIIFILFIMMSFISSIILISVNDILAAFKFLIFYLIFVVVQRNLSTIDLYLKPAMVAVTTVLLINFIMSPFTITTTNYEGIFANPNNLGIFASTAFIFNLGILIRYLQKSIKNPLIIALLMFFLMFTFYLIIISASRTAFFASLIALGVLLASHILLLFRKGKITVRLLSRILIFLITFTIIMFALLKGPFYEAIYNNIIAKIIDRGDNLTSSRDMIWKFYLDESGLIGANSQMIRESIGFSTHNSYLNQIIQYGWISGVLYILFWLGALVKSINYYTKYGLSDPNAALVLMSIVLFVSMSMMESINYTFSMYLALLSSGYIFKIVNKKSTSKCTI